MRFFFLLILLLGLAVLLGLLIIVVIFIVAAIAGVIMGFYKMFKYRTWTEAGKERLRKCQ